MTTHLPLRMTPAQAARLPIPAGRRSALIADTGSVEVRHYAPPGVDAQTPHDRDEFYVVIAGRGRFRRGREVVEFAPGDLLYCDAWVEHRFEDFSADFACWVVFFGPQRHRP